MIDTEKLENAIKESGKKKKYLADKCGLSYTGFRNCCTNRADFKVSHVDTLCEELNINDLIVKESIFFARTGA